MRERERERELLNGWLKERKKIVIVNELFRMPKAKEIEKCYDSYVMKTSTPLHYTRNQLCVNNLKNYFSGDIATFVFFHNKAKYKLFLVSCPRRQSLYAPASLFGFLFCVVVIAILSF